MNLLGYLALLSLIVCLVLLIRDCIILYKLTHPKDNEENNDADRESREDI